MPFVGYLISRTGSTCVSIGTSFSLESAKDLKTAESALFQILGSLLLEIPESINFTFRAMPAQSSVPQRILGMGVFRQLEDGITVIPLDSMTTHATNYHNQIMRSGCRGWMSQSDKTTCSVHEMSRFFPFDIYDERKHRHEPLIS